ncbi:MAG: hypothetical protein KatS3mg009_1224 [Acidimicrobiia bacterium]|nr:MAG: hypothetical protein KatS3mg009_1224 [Acidimicrobiia bacterium]
MVVLLVAVAFAATAVTAWWVRRAARPGATDVGFYDDMTAHHFQAIAIANHYLRNGDDTTLRTMAWEIAFTQAGDIRVMQDALADWGETGSPDVAMDWMGMPVAPDAQPGMASAQEMAALEQARGRTLDDLFTRLMIDHHAGGIHMAAAAQARARLGAVRDLADAIAQVQRTEISELNFQRERLGLGPHEPDTG